MTASIALLGLGEAGSEIARDLVAAGADVRGYDPKGILVTGVAVRISEANAVRDADEMSAAAEQLAELGIPPRIAAAARDLLIELRDSQSQELP